MDERRLRRKAKSCAVRLGGCPVSVAYDMVGLDQGGPPGTYVHAHCGYEVHIAASGDHRLMVEGEAVPLPQGEGLAIAPGVRHHCISGERGRRSFCYQLPGEKIGSAIQPLMFPERMRRFTPDGLQPFLDMIHEEYRGRRSGSDEMVAQLTGCLLLELARALSGDQRAEKAEKPAQLDRADVLDHFFVIGENRNPRKEELARLLGVSERQAERVVREYYGISFREKVMQTRMETAAYLLYQYGYTVSRVAELVGYENTGSFCAAYKRYFDEVPSARLARGK